MFKRILSLVLVLCALCLSLPVALNGAMAGSKTYYIEVDIANQITTVYRSSTRSIVRQMICSTGTGDKTPRGTFKLQKTRESTDRKPWYYISTYHCYVKYATRIKGGILFHSIPYTARDMNSIDKEALAELGRKASHGCVRLRWQDAKWIALNCPDGTTVKIFNGAAKKEALRQLLLKEGFSDDCGLTYQQFLESDFGADGAGGMGRGSSGDEVLALQTRLIGLGFLSGKASGTYDNATIVAVMRYQAAAGLSVSGVANKALIERIMAENDLAAEYATLTPGISGTLVAKFQHAIRAVGFYEGEIDGVYNDALAKAMDTYGRCMDIEDAKQITPAIRADIYGLRKELNKRFGEGNYAMLLLAEPTTNATTRQKTPLYAKATTASKVLTTVPKNTPVKFIEKSSAWCKVQYNNKTGYIASSRLKLTKGERLVAHWGLPANALGEADMNTSSVGDGVVALQDRLRALGFYPGESSPLYDDATAEAISAYQSAAGLAVTGTASVALQEAIMESDAITGMRVTLSKGINSPAVAALQRTLLALQYYKGACDGDYDRATANAVSLFTRTNGMAESAIATPEVQVAVFEQYLDCEAKYGSGNYILTFEKVETRVATAKAKSTLYVKGSLKSDALATMKKGDSGTVLKEGLIWCKLLYNGKTGFVRMKDVKLSTRIDEVARFITPDTPNENSMVYGDEAGPEESEPAEDGEETGEDEVPDDDIIHGTEPAAEEGDEAPTELEMEEDEEDLPSGNVPVA